MKKTKIYEKSLFHSAYNLPYDDMSRAKLYRSSKGDVAVLQRLRLAKSLAVHSGCVNTISWNETGEYLLSGSDDQHLVISDAFTYKVVEDFKTSHRANIFSAKFLPCIRDTRIVSCSGDGIILFTDLMAIEPVYKPFNCHCGTAYEVATVPLDPHSFLSCGEDGTVRWYDLRIKDSCNRTNCLEDVMIQCQRAVTAMSVNLTAPFELAIGCSDSTVRLFDRRMLGTKSTGMNCKQAEPLCAFTVPSFKRAYRITSLCFSPEGEEILVSYSSDDLYLFSLRGKGSSQLKATSALCKKGKLKLTSAAPTPVRRLRLRGDWSDTGPDARPEREAGGRGDIAQARPTLHTPLMQHLTNVISRLLNDPATRAALTSGVDDASNVEGSPEAESVAASQDPSDARLYNDDGEDVSDEQSNSPPRDDDDDEGTNRQVYEPELQEYELFEDPSTSFDSLPSTSRNLSVLSEEHNAAVDGYETPFNFCNPASPAVTQPQTEYKIAPFKDPDSSKDHEDCETSSGQCLSGSSDKKKQSTESFVEASSIAESDSLNVASEDCLKNSSKSTCAESTSKAEEAPVTLELNDSTVVPTAACLENDKACSRSEADASDQLSECSREQHNMAGIQKQELSTFKSYLSDFKSDSTETQHGVEPRISEGNPYVGTNKSCSLLRPTEQNSPDKETASSSQDPLDTRMQNSGEDGSNDPIEIISEPHNNRPALNIFSSPQPVLNENLLQTELQPAPATSSVSDREVEVEQAPLSDPEAGPSIQNFGSSTDSMSDQGSLFSDYDSEEDEEDLRRELRSRIAPPGLGRSLRSSHEIPFPEIKQQYTGHRNARTMIKEATFWGTDYVMSGSDCGHVFVWDRSSAKLVMLLQADQHVVNCLQPHPTEPLLATSGIDHDVKLWAPLSDVSRFDQTAADEIVKRNALMLEETRDTITVPASFMIRMVACLNQIRRGGRTRSRRRTQESQDE